MNNDTVKKCQKVSKSVNWSIVIISCTVPATVLLFVSCGVDAFTRFAVCLLAFHILKM